MDHQPTTWVDDDPSLGIEGTPFTAARMGNLETGVVGAHTRIAAPCMRAHTANVVLADAVVTADLDNGDRVLLAAQTNTLENGVYTYNGSIERYVRDANEIYAPGRVFPVVTKTQLGVDEDYTAPALYACTDAVGADRYTFTRVTGSSGAVSEVAQPAFTAAKNAGVVHGAGWSKVAFAFEIQDTHGTYDTATSRFTVPVAGRYQINVIVKAQTSTATMLGQVYKNGVGARDIGGAKLGGTLHGPGITGSVFLDLLAGDYIETFIYCDANTTVDGGSFQATRVASYGTNPAKRVKGRVNANGTLAAGAGFTVQRTPGGLGAGDYTITFTTPFAARPVMKYAIGTTAGALQVRTASATVPTTSSVRVSIYAEGSGTNTDAEFEFTAEDPGLGLEATMDVEPWHVVGAAAEPAFQNGWVGQGAAPDTARFRKTPDGKVHLDGRVKSGVIGLPVFMLPPGYRPTAPRTFAIMANGVAAYAWVDTNGNVNAQTGANTNYGLNGIDFFTD